MESRTCPTCGAAITAEQALGFCPACLLQRGLQASPPAAQECASCRSVLVEDARFCAWCGAAAPAAAEPGRGDPLRQALESKLLGHYQIVRLLGHGGMGAVYLARDLTLDRQVAIKVVKTDSITREMYERFRREARTAARLSHPNIVPLHAFGEVEGMPYFVMGYVRGESLAARLRRDGQIPEEEARRILGSIAAALDHAHRQGVVHRDVKPDNVLLEDESGRALLTDFGVAKAVDKSETLTRFGNVVGTPHYMSPEQATGRAGIDGRSDLYSLGVMGYAMLSGHLPFEGNTAADVLSKHLTQEPPALHSLAPSISDAMVQAVERCLAKDPAARWQDARSFELAIGVGEESQLPDALQTLDGRGVPGLLLAAIWLLFVLMSELPGPVKAIQYAVMAFIYVFVVSGPRREGFSLGQVHRVLWREPSWWLWWYPRGLRRPGNVLDRLPAAVRSLRWWPLIVFAAPWIFFPVCVWTQTFPNYARHPNFFMATMAGFAAIIAVSMLLITRARVELARKGLAPADAQRVMFSMPLSRVSFWARPQIAAILSQAGLTGNATRSDSPHDQLQSILRHANALAGPFRSLGAQAAVAARQLLASIDDADRQIRELAQNLEAGEEERLAEKIAALGAAPESDPELAPLRSLLEKQLELIRGLSSRLEEAKEKRNRRIEMLRSLSLHLASLSTRAAETPSAVERLTDDVRALCDDIEHQEAALTEPGTGSRAASEASTVERPAHR